MAERARRVNGEYIAKARTLDHEHSRQADGTRYPGVRERRCRVTSSARCWRRCAGLAGTRPVLGLVVGSYQGCSEALHGLAREAQAGDGDGVRRTAKWRQIECDR